MTTTNCDNYVTSCNLGTFDRIATIPDELANTGAWQDLGTAMFSALIIISIGAVVFVLGSLLDNHGKRDEWAITCTVCEESIQTTDDPKEFLRRHVARHQVTPQDIIEGRRPS